MDLIPTLISNKPKNSNTPRNNSKLRIIFHEVCEKHGLVNGELINKTPRFYPAIAARNEFFYRACTETKESFGKIGRFVNADHTAVHYGADRYALHHNLAPPRDKPLAKAARAKRTSYPKSLTEVSRANMWKRDNLDIRYMEDIKSLSVVRRRAMKSSAELLTLLRKHHSPAG